MKFTLGFSPCPNDTFIFDALVNKKIDTAHTTDDPNGPYTFTVTPDYFDDITRIWQHNNDEDYSAIANISYKTTWRKYFIDLKAGGLYRHKQRYNLQDEYDLKPTTNSNGVKQVFTNIYDAQWIVYNPAGTYDYDVNNYHAHEDVTAGFAEAWDGGIFHRRCRGPDHGQQRRRLLPLPQR